MLRKRLPTADVETFAGSIPALSRKGWQTFLSEMLDNPSIQSDDIEIGGPTVLIQKKTEVLYLSSCSGYPFVAKENTDGCLHARKKK